MASRALPRHGAIGRHQIHSTIDSIVRENQVSSTATSSFFKGLALGSQRPDIDMWSSTEKQLLDTVHGMMKDTRTRPSLIQPIVKASYAMAGLLVGRVASPGIRDAIVGGLYDSIQDSSTNQLRILHKQNTIDTTEDIRSLIKTLRDKRESLSPEGHPGTQDTEMSHLLLMRLVSQEKDTTSSSSSSETCSSSQQEEDTKPMVAAATLTKHVTSLLSHIATKI